jgi:hypothetical protein
MADVEKIIEIPVVEEVLSNTMAVAMLASGIVAGAFFLYIYLEWKKQQGLILRSGSTLEAGYPPVEEIVPEPAVRGSNQFDTFNQGA